MTDEITEVGQTDVGQGQEALNQRAKTKAGNANALDPQLKGAAGDQEVAPLKSLDDTAANPSMAGGRSDGELGGALNMDSLMDVPVTLSVEIGRKRMPINQLVSLSPGSIVDLNRDLDAPLDLLVNGTLVARGEVVVMGKKFGLRLVSICGSNGLSQ